MGKLYFMPQLNQKQLQTDQEFQHALFHQLEVNVITEDGLEATGVIESLTAYAAKVQGMYYVKGQNIFIAN